MMYRSKAAVIDAVKFTYPPTEELRAFLGERMGPCSKARHPTALAQLQILDPSGGTMHAVIEGNYIIREANGGLASLSASMFAATYESVDAA